MARDMKCKCGGIERKEKVSKEITLAGQKMVVRNVDAYVCDKCGEVYLNAAALLRIEKRVLKQERLAA